MTMCSKITLLLIATCTFAKADERDLLNQLFQNYNTQARPVLKHWKAVETKLVISLVTLDDTDLKKRSVSVGLWMQLRWYDEFLVWNDTESDEGSVISLDPKNIWIPDLAIGNYLRPVDFLKPVHAGRAVVRSDGHVTIWPTLSVEFGINASVKSYPFDTQDCEINFFSWSYSTKLLRLRLDFQTLAKDSFGLNGEWDIQNIHAENYSDVFENDLYDYVTIRFQLKRKWLYYLVNVMAPIVVTSILNIVCFQLPPESGEKVTLSISIFLTLAVFQNVVNSALPESSDGLSILTIYIGLQLVGSVLTITMTVMILKLHHKAGEVRVSSVFLRFINQTQNQKALEGIEKDVKLLVARRDHATDQKYSMISWQMISTTLNIFCFIMSIIWNIGLMVGFVLAV